MMDMLSAKSDVNGPKEKGRLIVQFILQTLYIAQK